MRVGEGDQLSADYLTALLGADADERMSRTGR
jgi:hypothetical protein